MKIYIDADSIQLDRVEDIIKTGMDYKLDVILVHDYNHEYNKFNLINYDYCEDIVVDCSKNSSDFKIINMCKKGDIVISKDYGLASLVLSKKASCINPNGFVFTNKNILYFQTRRHIKQTKNCKIYDDINIKRYSVRKLIKNAINFYNKHPDMFKEEQDYIEERA